MSQANIFTRRTKVLVGLPLVLLVVAGICYDPKVYSAIVGLLTLPVALAFPLLYATLPWKESLLGKALMTHARAVALLYAVGIFSSYYYYPFHGYVMALVTTYLAIGIGFQFVVLFRLKTHAIRAQEEAEVLT